MAYSLKYLRLYKTWCVCPAQRWALPGRPLHKQSLRPLLEVWRRVRYQSFLVSHTPAWVLLGARRALCCLLRFHFFVSLHIFYISRDACAISRYHSLFLMGRQAPKPAGCSLAKLMHSSQLHGYCSAGFVQGSAGAIRVTFT